MYYQINHHSPKSNASGSVQTLLESEYFLLIYLAYGEQSGRLHSRDRIAIEIENQMRPTHFEATRELFLVPLL